MNKFRMIAALGIDGVLGTTLTTLLDNYVKIYDLGELI